MATMVNRPDYWLGLALNRDPNDGAFAPYWLEWTSRFRKLSGLVRGEQFELAQGMAAEPSLELRDVDEYLNPENTSSPYYTLVQPYREVCMLAQWPNAPVGGAVNLFNTGAWHGNKINDFDGSFESYAVGATPNWLGTFGGTTPTVTSGAAFQGSQKLGWNVAVGTTAQGVSWPVACIPGRQYTSSAYVSQDSAATQRIDVTDVTAVADPYAPRTVANGLGTPTFAGPAWTTSGGAAADYSVTGGSAYQSNTSVNVQRHAFVDTGSPDHAVSVRMALPVVSTGAPITLWALGRATDASNYYAAQLSIAVGGPATLSIYKRVAGALTLITAATVPTGTHYAGDEWNLTLSVATAASGLIASAWKAATPQVVTTLTATDTALTTGNLAGWASRLETGNTNTLPVSVSSGEFQAVASIRGTSTTATGAGYTRLSVTFTATQPVHTIRLTTAPAVTTAVRLDAIQHEQAAAASAYTTSGPVIYPIIRYSAEAWPREYESGGFEGITRPPGVDGFASLNAIDLLPELSQTMINLGPDYLWRLNDGVDTLSFSDTSGQGRSPLTPFTSKYGIGAGLGAGTAIDIAGEPGAAGVKFTYSPPVGLSPGQILTGRVAVPPVSTPVWSFSASMWIQLTAGDPNGQSLFTLRNSLDSSTTAASTGIGMTVNLGGTGGVDLIFSQGFSYGPVHVAGNLLDGKVHHIGCVVDVDTVGGSVALRTFVDGATSTLSYSLGTTEPMTYLNVGGGMLYSGINACANGTISSLAFWNRHLSNAEMLAIRAAGVTAGASETAGARSARHLVAGGYTGATRITTAAPQTTMQPPSWSGVKDLLSDVQDSSTAEQGHAWVAPDGAVVIESRNDRWLRLTPRVTFGENYAGGEIPYLMDGLRFVPDPLYVYANVTAQRLGGAIASGGTAQAIAVARRRYFPRAVQLSADFETDALAQSCANYIFNTHNAPVTRVDTLVIEPFANPALWALALGLEVGQRVRFVRRAKAGNAGAGFTFSRDFFVEKIEIPEINFATGVFQVRVQLSPINAGGTPSMQPWILNDTTYSVLGQTTMLGW